MTAALNEATIAVLAGEPARSEDTRRPFAPGHFANCQASVSVDGAVTEFDGIGSVTARFVGEKQEGTA